jgi:hypothetical protein
MGSYILRITTEYADKDGREISLRKREELFADPAYRTLRIREPGSREGALVYTFWCGILPLVYETEIVTARVIVSRRPLSDNVSETAITPKFREQGDRVAIHVLHDQQSTMSSS